jgi:magnesium chelatase subunit D
MNKAGSSGADPAEGTAKAAVWADAALAAALFAIDPTGLRGVVVRAGVGPARDAWVELVRRLLPPEAPVRRIPLNVEDDRLLGGLDLAASLALGRPAVQHGLLAACDGGVAILPMAERMEDGVGARLASALDHGEVAVEREGLALRLQAHLGIIMLDEGATPEERPPSALLERVAFWLDLSEMGCRDLCDLSYDAADIAAARRRLARQPAPSYAIIEGLCAAAQMYSVDSIRAPLLALQVACAHAALKDRDEATADDAAIAARLVLGPRALTAPHADAPEAPPEPPPPEPSPEPPPPKPESDEALAPEDKTPPAPDPADSQTQDAAATDLVIDAIKAALPADLLAQVKAAKLARAPGFRTRGEGASTPSQRRGRPIGARQGALRPGDRLNLPATLRAATPWQKLRAARADGALIQVRQEDFRIRRFIQKSESTTIFVVDASGSAAFQRLAEAKGAVELLLAKAYVSRTRVALIAFRSIEAELLLAPTRSLTRAKRQLAELPGGGGTPLAMAMDQALTLALSEQAKDRRPLLVFLTDGRANIGRSGAPGRAAAEGEALEAAARIGAAGIGAVFVDTSPRPQPNGDRFAKAMGGVYAPLPYVNADAMAGLIDNVKSLRA